MVIGMAIINGFNNRFIYNMFMKSRMFIVVCRNDHNTSVTSVKATSKFHAVDIVFNELSDEYDMFECMNFVRKKQ